MAAVDQALKEFGKIDILINCESLLSETRGFLMGQQYQASWLGGPRTSVSDSRLLSWPNSAPSELIAV